MKKSTIANMIAVLQNDTTIDRDALLTELRNEYERVTEKARQNADIYAAARDIVINALTDEPATAADLYEKVKDELPEGFSKSKVQYGLVHMWTDSVTKHEMKYANMYSRA